MIMA